jgi:hypothetical protein
MVRVSPTPLPIEITQDSIILSTGRFISESLKFVILLQSLFGHVMCWYSTCNLVILQQSLLVMPNGWRVKALQGGKYY